VVGLGDASQVDTVRVEWPSGTVQEFHNLDVRQTLTVVERTGLAIAPGPQGEVVVTVQGPRQQRYTLEASANLTAWSKLASLTVTNADGTALFKTARGLEPNSRFFRVKVAD
jgi:hypothetical protein